MDAPAQPPTGSSLPSTGPAQPIPASNNAPGPSAIRRGAFRPHHHVQHHPRPPYPTHSAAQRGAFQPRPGFQRGSFRPPFIPRGRGRGSFNNGAPGGFSPHNGGNRPPLPPGSQPLALPQVVRRELKNVVPNEETIKNDYALWFALTGTWSADWVKRVEPEEDCKEYPKLRHLIDMKQSQVDQLSHPPFHLTICPPSIPITSISPNPSPYFNPSPSTSSHPKLSFSSVQSLLSVLPTNTFSSVLITPPPLIFAPNNSTTSAVHPADRSGFTYNDLLNLPIRTMSSDPSFVFLWVGEASGLGLERGREALLKWGYRRCEEVLWVKTNKKVPGGGTKSKGKDIKGDETKPRNLLVNMKEHCLMGIRGTVRRKTDGWFVHCNVDTDVMVYEQDQDDPDPPPYPPKLMSVIENFCLGTRRLHLFAPKSSARRGWVTVGADDTQKMLSDVQSVKTEDPVAAADGGVEVDMTALETGTDLAKPQVLEWDLDAYNDHVRPNEYGQYVLPEINEIENLRPKSPVRGDRGGRSDPNTPGVAGNGRGPAMGYGSDMGPGGARLARGGGPRMGTGPRMGSNGSQGQYYNGQSGIGGGSTRGTATLAGGSPAPPRFNGGNANNNMGALNAMANSFNANGSTFAGAGGGGGGGAGYHGGTATGHQPANSMIPNEMLMAMAMQQLQMQMQLQQQQFALQQQEMYRNLVANQQQGQTSNQAQGYDGGIGEDEYDGQHAWRAEGQ